MKKALSPFMQSLVPTWPNGKLRSLGGPFDVLYEQRATTGTATPPKKRGPKPSQTHAAKTLRTLNENSAPHFNTHIATKAEGDRTSAIRGRGNV